MDAEVASLLAYRMRHLVTKYGDSPQLAETVRQLLQGQRNARAYGGPVASAQTVEPLFAQRRLQVLGSK